MRRTRWGGRWPRRSCTRRGTRCGAGPTRSCGGSWRAGWGCGDDGRAEGAALMASEQDLVVETVRDILAGHEPFVLTADTAWDAGLWADLAGAGLTGVGLPEEAGGSGGERGDA